MPCVLKRLALNVSKTQAKAGCTVLVGKEAPGAKCFRSGIVSCSQKCAESYKKLRRDAALE